MYKWLKGVFIVFIIIFFISLFFPIKTVKKSLEEVKNEEFYIVYYDYLARSLLLIGDKKGLYNQNNISDYYVEIEEGPNPCKILSGDLYLCTQNYFIIYGTMEIKDCYIIKSTGWDILGDVKRFNNSFRLNYQKSLTIYDYKWFDYILKPLGLYTDHPDF